MMEEDKQLYQWTKALCAYAGENEAFAEDFWRRLQQNKSVLEEYRYFFETQNFKCQYKIAGVSVVDLMVWQIDHFKAGLDREDSMRTNKDRMVLMAFDTFLRMEENPDKYVSLMQTQTGTDYPGKF